MSTIVYRGGIMAADTRAFEGRTNAPIGLKSKIRLMPHSGALVGVSSAMIGAPEYAFRRMAEWEPGAVIETSGNDPIDFRMLVVMPDGKGYVGDGSFHLSGPLTAEFWAIGSGDMIAWGAMAAGCTAVEAVEIAMKGEPWTGGKVEVLQHAPRPPAEGDYVKDDDGWKVVQPVHGSRAEAREHVRRTGQPATYLDRGEAGCIMPTAGCGMIDQLAKDVVPGGALAPDLSKPEESRIGTKSSWAATKSYAQLLADQTKRPIRWGKGPGQFGVCYPSDGALLATGGLAADGHKIIDEVTLDNSKGSEEAAFSAAGNEQANLQDAKRPPGANWFVLTVYREAGYYSGGVCKVDLTGTIQSKLVGEWNTLGPKHFGLYAGGWRIRRG